MFEGNLYHPRRVLHQKVIKIYLHLFKTFAPLINILTFHSRCKFETHCSYNIMWSSVHYYKACIETAFTFCWVSNDVFCL